MSDFELMDNLSLSISDNIMQVFGVTTLPDKITNSDILDYFANFWGYNEPNYLTKLILGNVASGSFKLQSKDPKSFTKKYLASFGNLNDYAEVQIDKDILMKFLPFVIKDLLIQHFSNVKSQKINVSSNDVSIEDVSSYILNVEKTVDNTELVVILNKMLLHNPFVPWSLDYSGNNKNIKKIMPKINYLIGSPAIIPINILAAIYLKQKIRSKPSTGYITDAEKKYPTLVFMGLFNSEISNSTTPFTKDTMLLLNIYAGKCAYYGILRIILSASYILNQLYNTKGIDLDKFIGELYSLPFNTFSSTMNKIFFSLYLNNVYKNDILNSDLMARHFLEDCFFLPTSFIIDNAKKTFEFTIPQGETELSWEIVIFQYMNWIDSINLKESTSLQIKITDIFTKDTNFNRFNFAKKNTSLLNSLMSDVKFQIFYKWQKKYLIGSIIYTEIQQIVGYPSFYTDFIYLINQYKTTGGKPANPTTSVL
uniref:Uncharacterized protein n=1 Tax=viral metagenome TaxID=1070528 RepID=A0A6C0K2N6_9ZZZZ